MPVMAVKVAASRLIGAASGRAGHSGTTLPGRLVLAADKRIIGRISRKYSRGTVIVSATNGKTTTSAMIASIFRKKGLRVARNREGANLEAGVASAVLGDASMNGRPGSEIGLFEVDEAALPGVAWQCSPRIMLLMNLFRDQLDRYGELEHIAGLWRAALRSLPEKTQTVLNADDPMVAGMASVRPEQTVFYGIEAADGGEMQHASDSKYCSNCGAALRYEAVFVGHLGKYHCPACGNTRPSPTVQARDVRLGGMAGSSFTLVAPGGHMEMEIRLPGLYNVYNALAAAAACTALGLDLRTISEGLAGFSAAFGRVEKLSIEGKAVMLLLVKNPVGFNEVVRTLMIEPGRKTLLLALNDHIADGRDISWIWDVDMEALAPAVAAAVTSGTRAWEMAMRLKYAGVEPERIEAVTDLGRALERALELTGTEETLFVLPTYTAMLSLRQEIHQHFSTDRELGDLVWK
ncbi:UDP-N-acetylmuramate--L-alanine ligase [bacterium BMS3Abin01]|nr:UDP-N-acetylmuramate--L-alanine ligase [bacterium BMS3Abin01]